MLNQLTCFVRHINLNLLIEKNLLILLLSFINLRMDSLTFWNTLKII